MSLLTDLAAEQAWVESVFGELLSEAFPELVPDPEEVKAAFEAMMAQSDPGMAEQMRQAMERQYGPAVMQRQERNLVNAALKEVRRDNP